jgi:geranylgeranyl reductase family protein
MNPALSGTTLPDQVASRRWDVAVVGGGPAGAVAAIVLSRRGHRVVLIEAQRLPREKVCGDALLPDALEVLSHLELLDRIRGLAHVASPVRVYSASRVWFDLPVELITLRRSELDAVLVNAAVEAGAVLCHARVTGLSYDMDGRLRLALEGVAALIHPSIAVVATGAQVRLLRPLGMVSRVASNAVAIRGYIRTAPGAPPCPPTISYDRTLTPGYGWMFPLGEGRYNVGVGLFRTPEGVGSISMHDRLERFVRGFPAAARLLAQGQWESEPRGAPLRCGLEGSSASDGRAVVAVGESLGTTYPFTGEGIGKAMASARRAAERVDAALRPQSLTPLSGFETELRVDLAPRFESYAAAERLLASPLYTDAVAWLARRNARFRERLAGVLREWLDPVDVLSPRGLVRLFTG